jgi:HSP20 family protein
MHGDILRAFADSNGIASRQRYFGGRYSPAADAFFDERTRELVARFELPGVTLEEIEVLVDRRELVVRGERSFVTAEGRVYQQVEMDYGPYERHVRITVDVEPEATKATYEAGILEVRMALAECGRGARRIDIQKTGGEE